MNNYQFGCKFNLNSILRFILLTQSFEMKGFYRNKKLQLQSTSYLQNLHFPTHDYSTQQQQSNLSQLSDDDNTSLSDYEDTQDINEDVLISLPNVSKNFHLISSYAKNSQQNLIKSIDQNKIKYNELLKKKQENRQKFIQKINKNLTDSQSVFLSSNPSTKNLKVQNKAKIAKISNEKQKKIPRSQTQQNKLKRQETIKDSESNWDKNSQIDFNLTSQRQQSTQKAQNKSAKKKITIKRKGSVNSSVKGQNQQKLRVNHQNEGTDKKESGLGKSLNELMFLEQYQKDNKQLMSRLLTIIEQDHMNRMGKGQISQSMVRQTENQYEKFNKMHQTLNRSAKVHLNQLETEYSSVKPIVINNYIKSPTEFMGKGLIESQMTIRMLEQNRLNKKSMMSSVADSRMLQESTIIALPSRQLSVKKQLALQNVSLQLKNNNVSVKENPFDQSNAQKNRTQQKPNEKGQNELDFELLYQKLKSQLQKQKTHPKNQLQPQTKQQSSTQKQSQLLPINSSRPQLIQIAPSSTLTTTQKTFATHNVSQNLTQFNHNSSIQSSCQTENAYNFKKPSVSMEIPFGNQHQAKEGVSLADAFKKKFGAGKFGAKGKTVSRQTTQRSMKQREGLSQLKGHQNRAHEEGRQHNMFNGDFTKKQVQSSGRKTIKISKKPAFTKQKQNMNPLQTPRSHSSHLTSAQQSTKLSKQPSKQLLDRLIYGQKATMTKKQMYELSKKNYMKLPEIQQKRKQEQKRLKQLQKKEKIKEYQKRIRTGKNSVCRESMKTSLEASVVKYQ